MNNLTYDQSVTVRDALTIAYEAWMTAQALERGSADDVLCRDNLTEYQRKWLTAFVALWETSGYTVGTQEDTCDHCHGRLRCRIARSHSIYCSETCADAAITFPPEGGQ